MFIQQIALIFYGSSLWTSMFLFLLPRYKNVFFFFKTSQVCVYSLSRSSFPKSCCFLSMVLLFLVPESVLDMIRRMDLCKRISSGGSLPVSLCRWVCGLTCPQRKGRVETLPKVWRRGNVGWLCPAGVTGKFSLSDWWRLSRWAGKRRRRRRFGRKVSVDSSWYLPPCLRWYGR